MALHVSVLVGMILGSMLPPLAQRGASQGIPKQFQAEFVTQLGDRDGSGIIPGMVRSVARDSQGNFWVTVYSSEPPAVFSPTGVFEFTAGREGEGPGEFGGETLVFPSPGDSVFVLDSGNSRLSVLDLSGSYKSSFHLAAPSFKDLAVLPNGDVVLNASIRTPSRVGYPLHLYSKADPGIELSFGVEVPAIRPGSPMDLDRLIAVDQNDRILALTRLHPILEFWSRSGELQDTWEIPAPWFTDATTSREIPLDRAPFPQFVDVLLEGDLIWISALVPEEDWQKGYVLGENARGTEAWVMEDVAKVMDTVILAFKQDGTLEGMARLDAPVPLLLGRGYLGSLETYDEGHPVVQIWRLSLNKTEDRV